MKCWILSFGHSAPYISQLKEKFMPAIRKQEFDIIDGTPEKRLFLSIISDYNLKTSLCELIDNAIDIWMANQKKTAIEIQLTLDSERQLITIKDNAGGVPKEKLRLLIAPGASGNKYNQEYIGIFGVGGKRAGVALGEHVEIRTRYKKAGSYQIDINNDWMITDDWNLAAYEISDISPNSTIIEISKVRQAFTDADIAAIKLHIASTYSYFIEQGCIISVNNDIMQSKLYDHWAYPPGHEPQNADLEIDITAEAKLRVKITAGLIVDREPENENYGVYIYCNNRLIVKEMRSRDVGYFVTAEAGVPHPDASLCRVIINLNGPAETMPWNSSKSSINTNHPSFLAIRPTLITLVSHFSSLSRRLKEDWPSTVYQYTEGYIQELDTAAIANNKKLILPPLPRIRKVARILEILARNKKKIHDKPWTLGLIETIGLVEIIFKQKLETKNRAALILLDSNFEISLKEYIVNSPELFPVNVYNDGKISKLFRSRSDVIEEIIKITSIPQVVLGKVNYYYNLRNKLIHERATVSITDAQVKDYQKTIEETLKLLFGIKF